jgi:hypothetical protein
MSESTEPDKDLYSILKSKIDILRKWAELSDNDRYKERVNTLISQFDNLDRNNKEDIVKIHAGVVNLITDIPIDKLPPELNGSDAIPYDGGRRRKSASSSHFPRRRSSKKRGTQRKQKRRQRRGSRRA